MVVLGGMGNVGGPVLGAVASLLLEEVLSTLHRIPWVVILGPDPDLRSCSSARLFGGIDRRLPEMAAAGG